MEAQIDGSGRELQPHGTADFPCAAYETLYAAGPEGDICWHWHEDMELWQVLEGEMELRVPGHLIENVVKPAHIPYAEVTGLEEAMADLDILYMTRIQKERFTDAGEYERLKGSYVLDMPKMALGKADMAVLHPLPRVNEIALAVDDDPRAAYFKQVQYGVYIRMALIMKLLEVNDVEC